MAEVHIAINENHPGWCEQINGNSFAIAKLDKDEEAIAFAEKLDVSKIQEAIVDMLEAVGHKDTAEKFDDGTYSVSKHVFADDGICIW